MPRGVEATLGEHTVRSARTGSGSEPAGASAERRSGARSALDPADRAADHPVLRLDLRRRGQACAVRVPDLRHHRDAAQPAGLDAGLAAPPARARGARRLPLAGDRDRRRRRARGRRRRQPGGVRERHGLEGVPEGSRGRRSRRPSAASTASRAGSTRGGSSRVHVKDIGNRLVQNIQKQGVGDYAKRAVDIGQQVASQVVQGLIELLLIIVISIYLLLDGPRISRGVDRIFPPGPDGIRLGAQVAERPDPLCARPGDRLAPDRRELGHRRRDPLAHGRLARRRPVRADPRAVGDGDRGHPVRRADPRRAARRSRSRRSIRPPRRSGWASSTSASTSSRAT